MIIQETDDYIVINKPNGVASQGGNRNEEHIDKYSLVYLNESTKSKSMTVYNLTINFRKVKNFKT